MTKRAVISGYATLDFVARSPAPPQGVGTYAAEIFGGSAWPRAGGAALYAGRRLTAAGVIAAPLVAIGDDANGEAYLAACRAAGVSLEGVAAGPGRTPACILIHDPAGGCTCFLDPGSVAAGLAEPQARLLAQADLVCIAAGPPPLAREALSRLRPGQTLAWIAKHDPACFPPDLAEAIAARADIVFCNAVERGFVDRARAAPPAHQLLIETRGAEGVLVETPEGPRSYAVQPLRVEDATGAGDTFAGEFLARVLAGADTDAAALRAIQASRDLIESRLV